MAHFGIREDKDSTRAKTLAIEWLETLMEAVESDTAEVEFFEYSDYGKHHPFREGPGWNMKLDGRTTYRLDLRIYDKAKDGELVYAEPF